MATVIRLGALALGLVCARGGCYGAVVFFSAAERVHTAKAGAEAERSALRGAASRAEARLTRAEAELVAARAAANKARAQNQCGPDCRTNWRLKSVGASRRGGCQAEAASGG